MPAPPGLARRPRLDDMPAWLGNLVRPLLTLNTKKADSLRWGVRLWALRAPAAAV